MPPRAIAGIAELLEVAKAVIPIARRLHRPVAIRVPIIEEAMYQLVPAYGITPPAMVGNRRAWTACAVASANYTDSIADVRRAVATPNLRLMVLPELERFPPPILADLYNARDAIRVPILALGTVSGSLDAFRTHAVVLDAILIDAIAALVEV
jgi:hypothetical protein